MKNDSGVILNKDSTLAEAGVHNGDTLYILQTDSNGMSMNGWYACKGVFWRGGNFLNTENKFLAFW